MINRQKSLSHTLCMQISRSYLNLNYNLVMLLSSYVLLTVVHFVDTTMMISFAVIFTDAISITLCYTQFKINIHYSLKRKFTVM